MALNSFCIVNDSEIDRIIIIVIIRSFTIAIERIIVMIIIMPQAQPGDEGRPGVSMSNPLCFWG